jgi:hypothetical protein
MSIILPIDIIIQILNYIDKFVIRDNKLIFIKKIYKNDICYNNLFLIYNKVNYNSLINIYDNFSINLILNISKHKEYIIRIYDILYYEEKTNKFYNDTI